MPFKYGLVVLVVTLGWTSCCLGQTSAEVSVSSPEQQGADHAGPSGSEKPDDRLPGSISGTVVDQSAAMVAGARVRLTGKDQSQGLEAISGSDGQFFFGNVLPGNFQLTTTAAGFAPQTSSGVLHSGESYVAPTIALSVATNNSEVDVTLTRIELAEKEIKIEEKQRVLGVVPNFYVSYIPDAVPLTPKQKFEIAWKTVIDPVTLVMVGATAGVEQAQDHFSEYGQGAQGYGKRFGADYADTVSGTFIGGAILPSLLKQDPRYFYKGTGSKRSRFVYAVANSFICKGDNGRWQPNYSNVMGSLAAGGISNLYYPSQDRDGAELTFENAALGLGATAVANILQEFFIKKITPRVPKNNPAQP